MEAKEVTNLTLQDGVIALFEFAVFLGLVWWGFQQAANYKGKI
jgi:hypothetical protein